MAAGCPLCTKEHVGCVFAGGSLGCAVEGCKNPHHRPEWVARTASDVIRSRPVLTLVKTGDETT